MQEFIDVDQLAAKFGLSRSWVYKICSQRTITHYKIGNRTYFKESDIDDFIERQRKPCRSTSAMTATENIGFDSASSMAAKSPATIDMADQPEPKRNWRNVN